MRTLDVYAVAMPATPAPATFTPPPVSGWQAVTLHQWEDTPLWDARDRETGEIVGTLYQSTPWLWQAWRLHPGYGAVTTDAPAAAMAGVDWLLCAPAGTLAQSLTEHPRGVCVVLADGTRATAELVEVSPGGTEITFSLDVPEGPPVGMARPAPVEVLSMRAEVPADAYHRRPRYRAVFGHLDPIALAPACVECETQPGEPCHPYASHDCM